MFARIALALAFLTACGPQWNTDDDSTRPCTVSRDEVELSDRDLTEAARSVQASPARATCQPVRCWKSSSNYCSCWPGADMSSYSWTEVSSCTVAVPSAPCGIDSATDFSCTCKSSAAAISTKSCDTNTDFSGPSCTVATSEYGPTPGATGSTSSTGSTGATGSSSSTGSTGATGSSSATGSTSTPKTTTPAKANPCASSSAKGTSGPTGVSGAKAPAWVSGSYMLDGATNSNIYSKTDERELKLDGAAKSYEWREGNSGTKGDLEVTATALKFKSGPLQGTEIALPSGVTASCRIVKVKDKTLARTEVSKDCPYATKLSSTDCGKVGTYQKSSMSGSSSSGSSDSTTIILEKDGFYKKTDSHCSWAAYGTIVKTVCSSQPATVGAWTTTNPVSGSGWDFSKAEGDAKCN